MSERDRRLAEKYAAQGRESASGKAARKVREKAAKDAEKNTRKARRHETAPAVPPPSGHDLRGQGRPSRKPGGEFDAAAWYNEYRDTPRSRKSRWAHKKSPSADAQSGGEAFADRSARSITAWFTGR
jgi:hypothetical protein